MALENQDNFGIEPPKPEVKPNFFQTFMNRVKEKTEKEKKKDKEGFFDEAKEEIQEFAEEVKEELQEISEEFKEKVEDIKEEFKEFKKENPFMTKYGKEASMGEKELFATMDEVLRDGDTQEIDLKNGNSLIVEQNLQGNIDIFHSGNIEQPLTSFNENLEPTNKGGWADVKGMLSGLTKEQEHEKSGLDKIIDNASKETANELESIDPKDQALNQALNLINEMLDPGKMQK